MRQCGGRRASRRRYPEPIGVSPIRASPRPKPRSREAPPPPEPFDLDVDDSYTTVPGITGSLGVVLDQVGGVAQAAIHLAGERGLGEARADVRSDVHHRHGVVELFLAPIG